MAVFVTGASGLVGLNVLERLLSAGRDVVAFSATPIPSPAERVFASLPGRLHVVTADMGELPQWDPAAGAHAIDGFIHCAAITPNDERERRDFRRIVEVNLMGTVHALEAASRWGVRRFVYCSSGAVYGANSFVAGELAESVCPAPQTLYAVTKLAGEGSVLRYGALHKLDVVVARLGAVFGRWEHDTGLRDMLSAPMQTTALAQAGGEAVLPREGLRDWIYGPDIAAALEGLLDAPRLGWDTYNLGPGASWSMVQWCERLVRRFPRFRYRIAAHPGEANINFHSQRDRSEMQIARIVEDLGFRPRYDLEASQEDYLAWRLYAG